MEQSSWVQIPVLSLLFFLVYIFVFFVIWELVMDRGVDVDSVGYRPWSW